ncbi:MAG: hypothetical protein ACHRHE_21090, partial [Tepidisphaerales bacterium]
IKTQLGSSEDEWKVLSPKIEKVMTAQRDARAGGFGGGRGGRGGGNNPPAAPPADASPLAKAQYDLRVAVDAKAAPDELTKKLAALREARDKADATVAAAQKELKDVLTVPQEAVLVMMGMLK